jgi:hypothetical protein
MSDLLAFSFCGILLAPRFVVVSFPDVGPRRSHVWFRMTLVDCYWGFGRCRGMDRARNLSCLILWSLIPPFGIFLSSLFVGICIRGFGWIVDSLFILILTLEILLSGSIVIARNDELRFLPWWFL